MGRRSLKDNIDLGILTTYNVASILNVSPITVRRWLESGMIPKGYLLPGTTEWRIPAPAIISFLETHKMSVPQQLVTAKDNYNRYYDQNGTPLEKSQSA